MPETSKMATMPVQLLARIMSLLTPTQRLQSAALVCSTWRTAAVMATHDINVLCVSPQQSAALPSLSGWLSAHGADANVRVITAVQQNVDTLLPELQLPTGQLQGLEHLGLRGVNYAPLQHSSSSTESELEGAPALVLSELTALTSLELSFCQGSLKGLSSCTGLQQLAARAGEPPELPFQAEHLAAQLSQALPSLTALTTLVLDGPVLARDDVVQQVSALPCLQDLILKDSTCSASSFKQLPQSLTALSLGGDRPQHGPAVSPVISPSTTPGICQLTALRKLHVLQVDSLSLEVLTGLTSLEELKFSRVEFKEPGTLSVLAALTQLKHLELPAMAIAEMPTPADVAAATANSQLTYLNIVRSHRSYPQHRDLFPPGRQLPHLVELHVSLALMERSAGKAAAACCPNLQKLLLYPNDDHDFVEEAGLDEEAWGLSSMLEAWQQVQSLTCLSLDAAFTPMAPCVWEALGAFTQLRKLDVKFWSISYMSGLLSLSGCRRLEELRVTGIDPELFDDVAVVMVAKAGEDGATSIHHGIPKYLQQAALDHCRLDHFGQHPKLVKTLLKIAADAQHEQQKALEELQQQVAELKAGAAQQVALEQRVGEL